MEHDTDSEAQAGEFAAGCGDCGQVRGCLIELLFYGDLVLNTLWPLMRK